MTDAPLFVIVGTIALIVLSAFFVIIEFSLLAARRHRLEEQASTSAPARAAPRGMNELTIMLAVAQFGITICTFALGAITKPAVDSWLAPLFSAVGAPFWLADSAAFVLSLLFVTFLHLVIGEMAPKSWAIAHPELAATIIALPARSPRVPPRPLLVWSTASPTGSWPQADTHPRNRGRSAGRTSIRSGARRAFGGRRRTRRRLPRPAHPRLRTPEDERGRLLPGGTRALTSVPETATAGQVRDLAAESGHMRILVERAGKAPGVVHVRDVLLLPADHGIEDFTRDCLVLDAELPVHEALTLMRDEAERPRRRHPRRAHRRGGDDGRHAPADPARRVEHHALRPGRTSSSQPGGEVEPAGRRARVRAEWTGRLGG